MYNEVINLLAETRSKNKYGDVITEHTKRQVFCKVASVGMNEFYQAQANGIKADLKIILSDYLEYNDERKLEYDGKCYDIIRTYRTVNNQLEITASKGNYHVSS